MHTRASFVCINTRYGWRISVAWTSASCCNVVHNTWKVCVKDQLQIDFHTNCKATQADSKKSPDSWQITDFQLLLVKQITRYKTWMVPTNPHGKTKSTNLSAQIHLARDSNTNLNNFRSPVSWCKINFWREWRIGPLVRAGGQSILSHTKCF